MFVFIRRIYDILSNPERNEIVYDEKTALRDILEIPFGGQ